MPRGEHESADEPPGNRNRKPSASNSAPVAGRYSCRRFSSRAAPTSLNCPRRGSTIAQTAQWRPFVHCPRCLGCARTRVELFASTLRAEQLHANRAPFANAGRERQAHGAKPDDEHGDRAPRLGTELPGARSKKGKPVIERDAREVLGAGAAAACCPWRRAPVARRARGPAGPGHPHAGQHKRADRRRARRR